MEHECEHVEKIIEMRSDIKWLVADCKKRNGIMEEHVKESDRFRHAVERNTVWRHAFKIAIIGGYTCIGLLWGYFFYYLNK